MLFAVNPLGHKMISPNHLAPHVAAQALAKRARNENAWGIVHKAQMGHPEGATSIFDGGQRLSPNHPPQTYYPPMKRHKEPIVIPHDEAPENEAMEAALDRKYSLNKVKIQPTGLNVNESGVSTKLPLDVVHAIGDDHHSGMDVKAISKARGMHGHVVRSALNYLGLLT